MEIVQVMSAIGLATIFQYYTKRYLVVRGKPENLNNFTPKDADLRNKSRKPPPTKPAHEKLPHKPGQQHPASKTQLTREDLLIQ